MRAGADGLKNKAPSRNHHILPEHYLAGFVESPSNPHFVWVYELSVPYRAYDSGGRPNPQRCSLRSAAAERDHYSLKTFQGDVDYDRFEGQLQRLESQAEPVNDFETPTSDIY